MRHSSYHPPTPYERRQAALEDSNQLYGRIGEIVAPLLQSDAFTKVRRSQPYEVALSSVLTTAAE